jgi:hypothetical protein
MKVKPKISYKLAGTNIEIDKNKVYEVSIAKNIPNANKDGLIWCEEILLKTGEYEIIEP